jgi:4-hydroxy-3-methylbut-2-enyl diphosphate reductase
VSAGASTPEALIQGVLAKLAEWGVTDLTISDGDDETVEFNLPVGLR